MYQDDWILRQIELLVRFVARIVFKKDKVKYEIIDINMYSKTDLIYKEIMQLLRELRINEAENLLYDSIDRYNTNYIKIALEFYDRLNELNDEDLEKGNFTRAEIKMGLMDIMEIFNIDIPDIV